MTVTYPTFQVILFFALYLRMQMSSAPCDILRYTSETATSYYYINFQGYARKIVEQSEISILCNDESSPFDSLKIRNVSSTDYRDLRFGSDIAPIHPLNESPDEIMRIELLRIDAYQSSILHNLTLICGSRFGYCCKNPTVIPWQGSHLWIGEHLSKKDRAVGKDSLSFFWMDVQENGDLKIDYISADRHGINGTRSPSWTKSFFIEGGMDARVVHFANGKLGISYNYQLLHQIVVRYAEIEMKNNVVTLSMMFSKLVYEHMNHAKEKNWTPFIYNDTVYFIQSINPLTVLRLGNPIPDSRNETIGSEVEALAVSQSDHLRNISWDYGDHFRGGSNAILVDDDTYLSFFHTVTILKNALKRETYFFGAYTFTAKPPFKLMATSRVPIVHPALYEGPWMNWHRRQVDYCPYPTQFYINRSDTIHLTIGSNDHMAYMGILSLREVLASLKPVYI